VSGHEISFEHRKREQKSRAILVGWPGLLFFEKLCEGNQVERHPSEFVIRMLIVLGRMPVLMGSMLWGTGAGSPE
jgi:hypothetical protein